MIIMLDDDDIILLRVAHRIKPGEMKKIIDDACSRSGRDPLEDYHLFVEQLRNLYEGEKHRKDQQAQKKEKRNRRPWKERWGKSILRTRWKKRTRRNNYQN